MPKVYFAISTICNVCLSTDRQLSSLKNLEVLPEWEDIGLNLDTGSVCWECRAVMSKILAFRRKAMLAQKILRNKVVLKTVPNFSTLTISKIDSYNKIYIDSSNISENDVAHDMGLESKAYEAMTELDATSEDAAGTNIDEQNAAADEMPGDVEYIEEYIDTYDVDKEGVYVEALDDGDDEKVELIVDTKDDSLRELVAKMQNSNDGIVCEELDDYVKSRGRKIKKETSDSESENAGDKAHSYSTGSLSEDGLMNLRKRERNFTRFSKALHKCDSCIVVFSNEAQYHEHFDGVHSEKLGVYVCRICEARYPDQRSLEDHSVSHTRLHGCLVCSYTHYSLARMDHHMRQNHDQEVYQCGVCDAEFISKGAWRYHKKMGHNERLHCEQCGKTLKSSDNLRRHMLSHVDKPLAQCHICKKMLKTKYCLRQHLTVTHGKHDLERCYCAECGVQFKNLNCYRNHLNYSIKHNTPEHECNYCQKKFMDKRNLAFHIDTIHLKKLDFACSLCDKKYSNPRGLRNHLASYHEGRVKPRRHTCEICGKAFTERRFLRQHMNSHTGDKPFKCPKCPAQFPFSSGLYMHNRIIHLKQKKVRK